MESILHQLFSGDYDITPKRDKTQQELYDQIFAETDQIEAALGSEFLGHLCDLDNEREEQNRFYYYRSGFLTGARLMLEVFQP